MLFGQGGSEQLLGLSMNPDIVNFHPLVATGQCLTLRSAEGYDITPSYFKHKLTNLQ
jgi:hypothetical protein